MVAPRVRRRGCALSRRTIAKLVRASFPPTVPCPGAALCSAGSLGSVPPRLRSYCGTPTSSFPASLTRACSAVPALLRRRERSPLFLGDLRHACPGSPIPVEPLEQSLRDQGPYVSLHRRRLPSLPTRRLPPRSFFRGPIPRPACSLSTLRSQGHPWTTQDSLPAGGPALLGGSSTRQVAASGLQSRVGVHMVSS